MIIIKKIIKRLISIMLSYYFVYLQKKGIKRYKNDTTNIIIFFIPNINCLTGGVISIFSLYKETKKLKDIHSAEVVLCTYPGFMTYYKNTQIPSNEEIFSWNVVKKYFTNLNSAIICVPDYVSASLFRKMSKNDLLFLNNIKDLHINIMNQNLELMPKPDDLLFLKNITTKITQTTAHDRYCNQEVSNLYNMPVKMFSTWIDSRQYNFKSWSEKEDILLYSPDIHPLKQRILDKIKIELPHIKQVLCWGFKYEECKEVMANAKYSLTFGEGFDGYFIEPIFCNTFGFAVYSDVFFPSDEFKKCAGVFLDYQDLENNICNLIKKIEIDEQFRIAEHIKIFDKINPLYSVDKYSQNIKDFYVEKYNFIPDINII